MHFIYIMYTYLCYEYQTTDELQFYVLRDFLNAAISRWGCYEWPAQHSIGWGDL